MTAVRVAMVDVHVVRTAGDRLEVLALRRSATGRCPGAWEAVHGHLDEGETPVDGAVREMREETGLSVLRLYNLSRVETFYLHRRDEVACIPAFAAIVDPEGAVVLSEEHDAFEWLSPAGAAARYAWPRERRAVDDLVVLLGAGDAGPLEDVLRIC